MVEEVIIIRTSDDIFSDDKLAALINKIDEQVLKTKTRPHVKVIIK